ncbi:MAG TPA: hypothetical protein VJM12_10210 [Pyrinomonadaceae bacterium]|nr:hypothetical protein [Pyrinomonadaceae bacterium]
MKADRIQQGTRSWAMSIGRALMASVVLLSLLSVLLPLIRASANSGLKACCVGKAGHESGSCSTGLLAAGKIDPQANLTAERTAKNKAFANVKGGAGGASHCSPESRVRSLESGVSGPRPTMDHQTTDSGPRSTSDSRLLTRDSRLHAVSSTCPNECGMCSVSYTRRPRPREQSAQSSAVRPPSTALIGLIVSDHLAVREPNFKWSQSPPRAPPALLV